MAAPWQLLLLLGCCLLAGVQPGRAAHVAAGGSAGRRLQQATPAAEEGKPCQGSRPAGQPCYTGGSSAAALSRLKNNPAEARPASPVLPPAVAAPDAVDGAPAAEGSCQAALNYSSVFMPPSAQLQFRLFGDWAPWHAF